MDCNSDCCAKAYLNVYSLKDQTIASLASPTLEVVSVNSGDFDTSLASTTGEIKSLTHGIYLLNWGLDGILQPPYPAPIPAWSFSVYINGVLSPGSVSGSFSISPDDLVIHDAAEIIFELKAGDVFKLVNTCIAAVNAKTTVFGSLVPIASARLNLTMLKKLP